MGSRTSARNTAQRESGSIQPSIDVKFNDGTTPTLFTIFTVPAKKRMRLNVLVNNVKFFTATSTIRVRLAGNKINEFVKDGTRDDTGVNFQSLDYYLKGGETVDISTTNTTTAKLQECSVAVSVLSETPQ